MLKKFKLTLRRKIRIIVRDELSNITAQESYENLERNVLEVNNYTELMKVFNWEKQPKLTRPDLSDFDYVEDLNERRLRDAESLGCVTINSSANIIVEIGTSTGMGTILLADNAPKAKIYTINIPPEEIVSGEGGVNTTIALEIENIGIEFKKRKYSNIKQIYANTAKWEPGMERIDLAFIDGSHDTWFVYNDTKKVLTKMASGSFILWHDFNLDLINKYPWINEVCLGVERLYREGYLKGRIYHIKDSWVGIYRVP